MIFLFNKIKVNSLDPHFSYAFFWWWDSVFIVKNWFLEKFLELLFIFLYFLKEK